MKFLRIKYKNYRCFKDVELNFNTDSIKNIALIVAPNGGGKTEMLFSFWWVLYDFNFADLKGKEDTPYSLNSALYRRIKQSETNVGFLCFVELEFEHDGIVYIVRRTEEFFKNKNKINSRQEVRLSTVSSIGETSLPETNRDIVEKKLTEIIPKSILYGIIFDGERMKQLNSVDELSKTAVEGVIKHITNEELFELCRTAFMDLGKKVDADLKKVAKKIGNTNLESILSKIESYHETKTNNTTVLMSKRDDLEKVQSELSIISGELKKNEASKSFEQQRQLLKLNLNKANSDLKYEIDDYCECLYDGYFMICANLFKDVRELIEQKDVPSGLTVEAVRSILERTKCICGHDICDEERKIMESLIASLPPDNISSAISEMLRQSEIYVSDVEKTLKSSYDRIVNLQKSKDELINGIAYVSTQITEGAPELIKKLETRYNELVVSEALLLKGIKSLENLIKECNDMLEKLEKAKVDFDEVNYEIRYLTAKKAFIDKCLEALRGIDEHNKKISLENINGKLNNVYSQISEDYSRGRRLYIVQFDKKQKYRLVSYYEHNYESMKEKCLEDGTIKSLEAMGKTDYEIHEDIVLRVLESNSTGQSKINTLAFAKAILDYSNEERGEDSTEIVKNYPFLIDSPFTELTDENLTKSATSLHEFTNQIILMASADSLDSVEELIMPYVGCVSRLVKADNESYSTVEGAK